MGSSNVSKFYFGKQFFYVFPGKRMTEFGLKFVKVLMLSAQLLGRIPAFRQYDVP